MTTVEPIAQPIVRLPFVNSPTLYLPDRNVFAAVDQSDNQNDLALFIVDLDDMTASNYPFGVGHQACYAFADGSDGNLYAGSFAGTLFRFDMESRTLQAIAQPFGDGSVLWGGSADAHGRVYLGTQPDGKVCVYDIAAEDYAIYQPMIPAGGSLYATQFTPLADGRVLLGISGSAPTIGIMNPDSGDFKPLMQWPSEECSIFHLGSQLDADTALFQKHGVWKKLQLSTGRFIGDYLAPSDAHDIFGLRPITGTSYFPNRRGDVVQAVGGEPVRVRRSPFGANDGPGGPYHRTNDGRFVGVSYSGQVAVFDLDSDRVETLQLDNASHNGQKVQMLVADRVTAHAVGSHFICMQMFNTDVTAKTCQSSLTPVLPAFGQINCGVFVGRQFYFGSYTQARIGCLDIDKPFEPGSNPIEVCRIGDEQNRPVMMDTDGSRVFIATLPEYGFLGGALSILDTADNRVETHRNIVPDQMPLSVFHHAASDALVGTTAVYGDCHTAVPKATQAVVYVWDTQTRQLRHTDVTPWPAAGLSAEGLTPDGRLIGILPDRYYLYDMNDRSFSQGSWPSKGYRHGTLLNDSTFAVAFADGIYLLNLNNGIFEQIVETAGISKLARYSDHELLAIQDGAIVKVTL